MSGDVGLGLARPLAHSPGSVHFYLRLGPIVTLLRIWRSHLVVAFLVGLVVGTLIGCAEGLYALWGQEVFGRYNELVAWAMFIDASALIAAQFALALLGGLFLFLGRLTPTPRGLVPLQLGETVFTLVFAYRIWTVGIANPALWFTNVLGLVLPPALIGLALGEFALVGTLWLMEHVPFMLRLRARYWLIAEAIVAVLAVAFAFTH